MARSEEAILRRALKRERSEDEQRKADRKDMEQSKLRKAKEEEQQRAKRRKESRAPKTLGSPFLASIKENPASSPAKPPASSAAKTTVESVVSRSTTDGDRPNPSENPPGPDERMREEGAWKCPSCGNENFASRNWCNSKTCNERRPGNVARPPPFSKNKPTHPPSSRDYRQRHLMTEPGAWDCPSCSYQNYASRDKCFNRSCGKPRPGGPVNAVTKSSSTNKRQRHDPETSKQLVWSKQADATTLTKNQQLRERYRTTGGEGMSQEEIDRAKILIARNERKRKRKKEKSSSEAPTDKEAVPTDAGKNDKSAPLASEADANSRSTKEKDAKRKAKSQKDKNKMLLERFQKTKGQGMKEDEVERAKLLLARAERKKAKRAKAEQSKTQSKEVKVDSQ